MQAQVLCISVLLLCYARAAEKPARVFSSQTAGAFQAVAWKVDLHLSGGLAGIDRALTISSNGDLSAEDRRQAGRVAGKATMAQLDQIAPLVLRVKSIPAVREDSRCRDCLSYNFAIEIGGDRFAARLDDTTLPDSGLADLARVLTALLNRTLPTK